MQLRLRFCGLTNSSNRSIYLIPTVVTAAVLVFGGCQAHNIPATGESTQATGAEVCRTAGVWLDPATNTRIPPDLLMKSLSQQRIVLLGENHSDFEHHRWQLHTLAGLFALHPRLVLGFEMFPRSAQPALDAWTQGRYTPEEFLKAARWKEVWGYNPEFYLPLFHFARQNRLPMVALNVDRELVTRVGRDGWGQIPLGERQGVSDPAPASSAYRNSLAEVYLMEQRHIGKSPPPAEHGGQSGDGAVGDMSDLVAVQDSDAFRHFVEAQLTWDRAMAEAILNAENDNPDALIVGILGRGHIEHGYGVPHQLADLGENGAAILLPADSDAACRELGPDVADAVFVLAARDGQQPASAKPRLGIVLEQVEGGVQVLQVIAGSVAEATGLAAGDIITRAAGFTIAGPTDLIEIIQRQAPGTWLPLEVKRGDQTHRFVAKFPSHF